MMTLFSLKTLGIEMDNYMCITYLHLYFLCICMCVCMCVIFVDIVECKMTHNMI